MRLKILTTINKNYTESVAKEVQDYFNQRGCPLEITVKEQSFDESNENYYKTDFARSFLELRKIRLLNPYVIRAYGSFADEIVAFMVDDKKAVQTKDIRGAENTLGKLSIIQVFAKGERYGVYRIKQDNKTYYKDTTSKKRREMSRDVYILIHEIGHTLENKIGWKGLHQEIQNDNFESYMQECIDKLYPKENMNKWENIVNLKGFGLKPLVERQLKKVFYEMAIKGRPMRVIEGYRSCERQDELYRQRPKVTNAKCGESFHQYGVAVDCNFLEHAWNAPEEWWQDFGNVAKSHGFVWGGDWKSKDKPHLELTLGKTINDFQKDKIDYSSYN